MNVRLEDFACAAVDADCFDHAAHLEVAWHALDAFGPDDGRRFFREGLRRVTRALGQPDKYHETITGFFLDRVDERRRDAESFADFRASNADLFNGSRKMLLRYYRSETLNSDEARRAYLPPDDPDGALPSPKEPA